MTKPFLMMSILVRDEADIIGQNLEWHRQQGVDRFVVIDHASNDGTTRILRRFARKAPLDLFRRDDAVVDQAAWTRALIQKAWRTYGHVWHIANDADEFYLPPPGHTLKSYLASRAGDLVLEVPRRNVLYAREDLAEKGWRAAPKYQSHEQGPAPEGMEDPAVGLPLPFEYYATNPKMVFQAATLKFLTKGAHRATTEPASDPQPCDLRILHFPFRDPAEFLTSARRLGLAARAEMAKSPQRQASHRYRRWLTMMDRGVADVVILDEAMPNRDRLQRDRASGLLSALALPADLAAILATSGVGPRRPKPRRSIIRRLLHRLGGRFLSRPKQRRAKL